MTVLEKLPMCLNTTDCNDKIVTDFVSLYLKVVLTRYECGFYKEDNMTLEQIADYILKHEHEFLNDDGFLDAEYIRERFNLTPKSLSKVLSMVEV